MIATQAGSFDPGSPWVSSTELSPGMGYPQFQHVPPANHPVVMKEEFIYTRQGR